MKNKINKINKKLVLSCIYNPHLKLLVSKNFKHIKYNLICYIKISILTNEQHNSKKLIDDFLIKFQDFFTTSFYQEDILSSYNFDTISEIEAIKIIKDSYIKFFCLDLKIIETRDNLDNVYKLNKLQINFFLLAKKLIMKYFPLKLNTIIETFNKFRKPTYEYIEIN